MRNWPNFVVVTFVILGTVALAVAVSAGPYHSGTVVSVTADRLVLNELVAGGKERQLEVRLTPRTRAALSERNAHPTDVEHTFTTTPINVTDIKPGDFVVVELRRGRKAVADSVTVTLRGAKGM